MLTLNLTQQVAEILGSAIVRGDYTYENPVPSEAVICEQMNVSRSAAREAVKSLAAKGLITSRARQGISIRPESEWNLFDPDILRWMRDGNPSLNLIKEFTELRISAESEAAKLAAMRGDKAKITLLANALERMRRAEQGTEDPLEADIAFHQCILDASGNRFFSQLGRVVDTTLRASIRFTNRQTGVQAASYKDHKAIYDAIAAGDPERASSAARALTESALDIINHAISERKASN